MLIPDDLKFHHFFKFNEIFDIIPKKGHFTIFLNFNKNFELFILDDINFFYIVFQYLINFNKNRTIDMNAINFLPVIE
jgi:hypothetical protein